MIGGHNGSLDRTYHMKGNREQLARLKKAGKCYANVTPREANLRGRNRKCADRNGRDE